MELPGPPRGREPDLAGSGSPAFLDKQLLTVDNHVGSPFQDRVYVSWTEFAADGSSYIWESYSSDYGETFSPRHLVSSTSPLCTNTQNAGTPQGPCNENQVLPVGGLHTDGNARRLLLRPPVRERRDHGGLRRESVGLA
ncbi:MAG: hypothetical protein ACR2KV_05900 [Solirubrobacteraceae bacterium]